MDLRERHAEIALRLLLAQDDQAADLRPICVGAQLIAPLQLERVDWDVLLELARENRITIRLYDRLQSLGIQPSVAYQEYVCRERVRIHRVIELMGEVSAACEESGVEYVFMKNFQHYPDMGDDIDLLVMDDKDKADQAIVKRLAAKPCRLSFLNQFGGKTQYSFDNNPICVEIHHGRMGRVGEHAIFPRFLMKNRVSAHLGGVCVFVPKPEDQFIIQVLQRVYGRLYLRISELAYSIAAMYRADLDWNYIVETSRVIGIYPGLGYYVSCVHAVHKRVMGTALPARPLDRDVPIVSGVRFGDLYYHLPSLGVASLYAKKLLTDFRVRNWRGIGRLTLIPFFIPLFWFKSWQRRAR